MKISEIIRNNVATLMDIKKAPSQSAFARHCGVAQKTINKMFTNENEIPSTTTVESVATKNGAAAWMLLLSDFPWEAIQGKPITKISADGYRLLQAFERSSSVTKAALLTHMAFLLQMQEGKNAEAEVIMEEQKKYLKSNSNT